MQFIDLAAQQRRIRKELEGRILAVLDHGAYINGPEIKELEDSLAAYCGAQHSVGCGSGTDALLMALMCHGVGPGDAVFCPPFTFIATAEVISLLGATPVFVDVEPATCNLDPAALERAVHALKSGDPTLHPLPAGWRELTPKGIITVDLFGLPADYARIDQVAAEHDLWVVEDAAQSFGAEYYGRRTGSLAPIACTSFFPAKPLGGYGDGGMVFCHDPEVAALLKSLRVHGQGTNKYDNVRIGYNFRLDTIQAAVILAKFSLFPEEMRLRQEVAARYQELIAESGAPLTTFDVLDGYRSAWAQFCVLAEDSDARTALMARLTTAGVPSAIYYPLPLHMQPAFEALEYCETDFPVSQDLAARIFALPMHPYLEEAEQAEVVAALAG